MKNSPYRLYKYMMMVGHICTDINQGALPAILPFLIAYNNISYTSAAGLVFAANFVSSIIQPLFGYLGDRHQRPWLIALGIFLAGAGLSVVGFLENYWEIFLCVVISGIGIAIFHPEGSRIANIVSGKKKGAGMSFFSFGGSLGFAIGPMLVSSSILIWGLKGTIILIIPAIIMSLVILSSQKTIKRFKGTQSSHKITARTKRGNDDWNAFCKLSVIVFCRSIVSYGLITFMPIYFVKILLQTEVAANLNLSIFLAMGALATLFGGRIADSYGFNRLIKICFVMLSIMIFIFLQINSPFLAALFVIPIAIALNGAGSVMIVLGQSFLPNRIGLAAGVTMGLAVSIGGVATPIIGFIGDKFGLHTAMYALLFFAVLAMIFSFVVPKKSGR
ncbi:MAG: MFS transporter [Campylobacteraceae bacterium]|jgi:FSR family fosmidomycin resistance protein-like MFS transporter|nr:MFS transporter [Campylobacteraceae bacterium]